jgi:hypothetical protein
MCACVPPPPRQIARRSPKMRVKQHWMGSSDTPTLAARVSAPPLRQNSKKDRNIEADLQFFLHTCATVLTHWLYDWQNNYRYLEYY